MENGFKRNLTSGSSIISNFGFTRMKKKVRSLSEGRSPPNSLENNDFSCSFYERPKASVSFYQEVTNENYRLLKELQNKQNENTKLEKLNADF